TGPLARAVGRFRGPAVNVCGALAGLPFPAVGIDNPAVGRAAADHLLGRGLRHFAFLGHGGFAFSTRREEGFAGRVRAAGFGAAVYRAPGGTDFHPDGPPAGPPGRLGAWLRRLPRPCGLFACNDIWGGYVTEVCRREGVRIPDDLAVVGVDDDDLLCELARPPLSSVRVPSDRIGFEAAALLDRLLAGRKPPSGPTLLPPLGVAVRPSSDLLAVDDPAVREVLGAIRGAGPRPVQVGDVVGRLDISRRSAERRFRRAVGRGIAAEIRRARVERAKDLLAGTGLSVAEVAARAGFPSPQRFAVAFRRDAGLTPTAYRSRHGPGRPG
ncbi:MAG: substrate-binding domain-containing protein, partial [Gemmataceae bacterium]|nr:substrate-binding domain-containing protein [Gemmataceae bacterium]